MLRAPGRLVWAEIHLTSFTHNFLRVKKLLDPHTSIMVVVKGNAYGHGIVPIAKKAESLKARYLGVVCLFEARKIREAGIKSPILLLNYTDEERSLQK
jgi:alanine racemase